MVSQKSEIEYLQERLKIANEKLSENRSINQGSSEKSIWTSVEGKQKVGTFLCICQNEVGSASNKVKKQTGTFTSLLLKNIMCQTFNKMREECFPFLKTEYIFLL